MNTDVNNYMFGSILAMSDEDVVLSVVLSIVVLILFVLYYNRIFAVTFDETFAKATGVRAEFYNMLLAFLTAITTVLGMRMMGALLISSLLIFPALTSMRLCHTFQSVVICSAVLSVVCFLLGMSLSFFLSSPAGATVVIVNLLAFLIFSAIARIRDHTAEKVSGLTCFVLPEVFYESNCNCTVKTVFLHPGDSDDVADFLLLFPERNGILTAQ